MKDEYCDQHAAHVVRIEALEGDTRTLWDKWDGLQKLLNVTLTTLCLNLLGVIIIIIKMFSK